MASYSPAHTTAISWANGHSLLLVKASSSSVRCRFERIWSLVLSAPNIQHVKYFCARVNISSKCARVLSYPLSKLYKYARVYSSAAKFKMASSSAIVAEAILEDKLADLCPDYPCLYGVRCPNLKNRDFAINPRKKSLKTLEKHVSLTSPRLSFGCSWRLRLRRNNKGKRKISSSSEKLELESCSKHRPCLIVTKHSTHAYSHHLLSW